MATLSRCFLNICIFFFLNFISRISKDIAKRKQTKKPNTKKEKKKNENKNKRKKPPGLIVLQHVIESFIYFRTHMNKEIMS